MFMNLQILIASVLTFLAFVLHTFQGDKELKIIEPDDNTDVAFIKREKWTMARCGWHWISFDLLLATIGLMMINFTDYFENEKTLLQILSIYFLGYGISWLIGIAISKEFPNNYVKLGQWILCWIISGLLFWGIG